MKYPKFKLNIDWELETEFAGIKNKTIIFSKGQIFEANENGEYIIEWFGGKMILDEDKMRLATHNGSKLYTPIEIEKDIEIHIEEIPDDDDILVRNWRIQLDVKTTRKKLKEVQRIIEEYVKPIL